jgi:hypothetical protein
MTNQFFKGESVILSVEIRDPVSNLLVDPTSVVITISTSTGTVKVKESPMIKASVGKYGYTWLSDEIGSYSVAYKADNNSNITISKDSFTVVK